jgi:geranylgeranyl diphosphate synthase type I
MPEARSVGLADDLLAVAGPVAIELDRLLAAERARWRDVDQSMTQLIDDLDAFVSTGGKRLRPAFVHWGFVAAGGDPGDASVVRVAAAMELLHSFALLHDDVMDGSSSRRGAPSYHERMRAGHRAAGWAGESRRFGEGLAILLGDLAFVYADALLVGAPPDVHRVWNEMRIELTMGQYLDVVGAARSDRDLDRSELIARYKSGRYTVERPLHLGAATAGRLLELAPHLSRFGSPLGEAFQLRDDLLGALGDEASTGKPVGDDLREGKPTVLLAYAQALATPSQLRVLGRVGQDDLDDHGVAEIQEVLVRSGAVDAVEGAIAVRVHASLAALDSAPITEPARRALGDLVDQLAWRDT